MIGNYIFGARADSIQSAPHLEFEIALAELKFYNISDNEDTQLLVVPQVVGKKLPQIRNVIRILYEEKKPEVKVTPYIETNASVLDKESFLATLDNEGRALFKEILKLYETHGFIPHYGTKGFSLNANVDGKEVTFLEGYGSKAAEGQRLWIYFSAVINYVKKGKEIADTFRQKLKPMDVFHETKKSGAMVYKFRKRLTEAQISELLAIIVELGKQLEISGRIQKDNVD